MGVRVADFFDAAVLTEKEEKQLVSEAQAVAAAVASARTRGEYGAAVREIAKLRPALDAFFDHVMVMVEDENLRAARLAMLRWISGEFSPIADFSEIVTESK
jgi:glycyl-tRNA synthetase beta chain